jgi:hypothetical protein
MFKIGKMFSRFCVPRKVCLKHRSSHRVSRWMQALYATKLLCPETSCTLCQMALRAERVLLE